MSDARRELYNAIEVISVAGPFAVSRGVLNRDVLVCGINEAEVRATLFRNRRRNPPIDMYIIEFTIADVHIKN